MAQQCYLSGFFFFWLIKCHFLRNHALYLDISRVSSIESKSSHPMAAALVDFAQSNSVEPKPDEVEHYQNFPGEGVYGKIDGKEIYIGNQKISSRAGCSLGKLSNHLLVHCKLDAFMDI